jgi:hypothetical protein
MFTACAISRDEATGQAYLDDDLRQRQKLMNKAANSTGPALAVIRASATVENRASLRAKIEATAARELRTEELARIAGLHDWYLSVYPLLTRAVHTQMRDLDKHVARGVTGAVEALTLGPSDGETGRLLTIGALSLVNARVALGEVYDEKTDPFVDRVEPLFRGMVAEWAPTHPGYDECGV